MAAFEIGDIVVVITNLRREFKGYVGEIVRFGECPYIDESVYDIDVGNNRRIYGLFETDICKVPIDYIKEYNVDLKDTVGFYKKYDEITEEIKEEEKNMNPEVLIKETPLFCFTSDGVTSFKIDPILKYPITPPIIDVSPIVPDKVVEVTFEDGTKEKAVCQESDVFSMDTAISICIAKKAMGGSSAYNKAVKQGLKVYNDKLAQEAVAKEEQKRLERKREKREAYKARRLMRRKAKEILKEQDEKEKQIEIQKEAYIRAMEYMKTKYGEVSVSMPGESTEASSRK